LAIRLSGTRSIIEDDRDVSSADLDLENRARFTYGYHFSEGWQVEIRVDKPVALEKGLRYPHCVAGTCGSRPRTAAAWRRFTTCSLVSKSRKPSSAANGGNWIGPDYDPDVCNLTKINQALRRLTK